MAVNLHFAIGLFVFTLLPVQAHAQDMPKLVISDSASTDQRIKLIDQWLNRLNTDNKFNGGVLIARNGKPMLMKTYGVTDPTAKQKLTPGTPESFNVLVKELQGLCLDIKMIRVGTDEDANKTSGKSKDKKKPND